MLNVTGIRRLNPRNKRMSRVPACWSTMPTTMKSDDLNSAVGEGCTALP